MNVNIISKLFLGVLLFGGIAACDSNASRKTIGNSQDSSSVNKAGGPPIMDTVTLNKDRRDSSTLPANSGNNTKGNADPSGRIKN